MLSFHPPAPANWSSPHPSLNRATLDPPLVPFDDSTPRRVIKPPPDLPRPWIQIAEIQSHEGEYPPGSGFCRREECAEKGLHCRSLSTSEGGRKGTADGRSRSSRRRGDGYSYSMKNRRPFTLRLTPNGWPFPRNVDLLCTTRWFSARWRWYCKFRELGWKSRDQKSRNLFFV